MVGVNLLLKSLGDVVHQHAGWLVLILALILVVPKLSRAVRHVMRDKRAVERHYKVNIKLIRIGDEQGPSAQLQDKTIL